MEQYLNLAASPDNPIGAYLPSTQALDPGATGFDVYTVDLGTDTIFNQANQAYMWNVPGGLDLGAYAVKFFNTGTSANPAAHRDRAARCAPPRTAERCSWIPPPRPPQPQSRSRER